ncbi:MAG: HEAT repeat domain-containing protein [Chloroflexi bacterium]|nr:HEAT repeat domain-containing protein [Chloroflexota bacterium]
MPDLHSLLAELFGGDDNRAEEVVYALGEYGVLTVDALCNRYNEGDADTRWWSVRALAEFGIPKAMDLFRAALEDENEGVRHCAALALRQQPDPASIKSLAKLLSSEDRILARLAADALIAIGESATPTLLEIIESGKQTARLEAVRALAAIGDHTSVSVLFGLLDDDSALIEYWADQGLEKMGIGMVFFEPD